MARMTSVSWTNWKRGSNPNMLGTRGSSRALASGVVMSGPSTFEKRSIATVTCGLRRSTVSRALATFIESRHAL